MKLPYNLFQEVNRLQLHQIVRPAPRILMKFLPEDMIVFHQEKSEFRLARMKLNSKKERFFGLVHQQKDFPRK